MAMTLIDSPFSNRGSIRRALVAAGADVVVSADAETIAASESVVLPGVGSFSAAMAWLVDRGIDRALRTVVDSGTPLLGICVGYQLLFESSEELGVTEGLGFCEGTVTRLRTALPVPHVGWNTVRIVDTGDPLFEGVGSSPHFYFVHSFAVNGQCRGASAVATYGHDFTAAIRNGSVSGLQFHPEKSGEAGLRVLRNFVAMSRATAGEVLETVR